MNWKLWKKKEDCFGYPYPSCDPKMCKEYFDCLVAGEINEVVMVETCINSGADIEFKFEGEDCFQCKMRSEMLKDRERKFREGMKT
jgi:hypothetical protein